MRMTSVPLFLLGAAIACTGRTADRKTPDRARDSATPAPLPARAEPVALSPDSVLVGAACPFECCQYGKWTLDSAADLRATPSVTAPIVAHLKEGTEVVADTGFVVVNPVGLVLGIGDFRQPETGVELHAGDTLFVLEEVGEGRWHARLHGELVSVSSEQIDTDGNYGAKLVRAPHSQWWAHFVVLGFRSGWVLMDEVKEHGADACGA